MPEPASPATTPPCATSTTLNNRTQDRYTIRGYISTAIKHGYNGLTVLRDALLGRPWMPDLAPT